MDLTAGDPAPGAADPSRWLLRTVPASLERRWTAEGLWDDRTLGELLDEALAGHPGQEVRIHSPTRPWTGTFGELRSRALRLAGALAERGVEPGDPVAFQLPNWSEAAVTFYAAALLGATIVPIVHFYGPREVGYILRRTGVRAFVTAAAFGHTDYLDGLVRMGDALDGIGTVAVVGATEPLPRGLIGFEALEAAGPPLKVRREVPVTAAAVIAYTSGTTADPKGVIHTHRTIGAEVRQLGEMRASGGRHTLTGAPVGHAMGMLGALLIPVLKGDPIHLADVWDPPRLLATMTRYHLGCGSGATYFLTSLLDHPDRTDEHLELMHFIGLGGSTVPLPVAERATALGLSLVRMYGSTEHPSITGSYHSDPERQRLATDGRPLAGVEVRLLDDQGRPVPTGHPGEIWSRGPDCAMGYTDPALTADHFDDDGWYRTEDVGVLDDSGFLTITDRKKDIIIRGGENISAAEVEGLLLDMDGVAEVAVVAAPDTRLGEQVCAFIQVVPGGPPVDLTAVQRHLDAAGLTHQKWPEQVRTVDALPRTASGKVVKGELRRRLREEHDGPPPERS